MYTIFNVGDKEYKLRLNTKGMVDIEERLGANPLAVFMSLSNDELPKLSDLMIILWAGLQPYNHGMTLTKTYEVYDEFVDAGNTFMDLIPVILDLFKVSGLFKQEDASKDEIEKN